MALQVTPLWAVSSATVFVKPAIPCFAALYADLYGLATRECMDPARGMNEPPYIRHESPLSE